MGDVHAEAGAAREQAGRGRRAAERYHDVAGLGPGRRGVDSDISTVGAAQKCVIGMPIDQGQISLGSTCGTQTCVAPAAVTAQVKHQPLQWNIGSVQRYVESLDDLKCATIASDCRYAPRWWYITPFGRPVVPLV